MEIEILIKKMECVQKALISFIDETDDPDTEYKAFIEILKKLKITQKINESQLLFGLISKIVDNHHRTSDFFYKLEQILQYLKNDIPISYLTPNYKKYNKRLLFLLLEKGFILPNQSLINEYLESKTNNKSLSEETFYYLYPVMKKYIDEENQKEIEEEILIKYGDEISIFEEKCQIGENDSYICSLIREDSVEEFISYVNRINLPLTSNIKSSFYETNSFLIGKNPTLIEYAAFFGSIQIIRYLKYSHVPLKFSLWCYSIHSNNAELIHFLEENLVKPVINNRRSKINLFRNVLIESIKCHHNAIFDYIKDYLYEQKIPNFENDFCGIYIYKSLNFYLMPKKITFIIHRQRNKRGFNLSQLYFSLTNITIPSSVTFIGNSAFFKCKKLEHVSIPCSVTSIGKYAFKKCSSLLEIVIPSSVTSIGEGAFYDCSLLKQIIILSSITYIGDYSFYGCSSLSQIKIPPSVTSIGICSFYGCSSLEQIIIPSSVTKIGSCAFSGCSSLAQITFPSSITSIGKNAFFGCPSSKAKIKAFYYFYFDLMPVVVLIFDILVIILSNYVYLYLKNY